MSEAGLSIADLSVGYRGQPVIERLNLPVIAPGKLVALVGPNAAGKTTLLRALAGVLPARGRTELNGQDLSRLAPRDRAALVAYMPQSAPARTGLSVIECVISVLRISPSKEARPERTVLRATAVLDRLGIADLALKSFDHLSGGQRQLASLALALARDPSLLLLDEPTSALDLRHQTEVMKVVRTHAEAGVIVIAVLHDLALAARWADNIFVFSRGILHSAGPPRDVITPDMLASVYGVRARVLNDESSVQIVVEDSLGWAHKETS